MSKRNFIGVPPKITHDVDIASRVNSYMQTCMTLPPETFNTVKESLDELNRLRRNAFMHDECGKTTSSIDAMHKYYDCFTSLTDKIQIKETDCPIPFRWKSAFEKGGLFGGKRDLTLNYGGYEQASVLFSIAAYQSQYASRLELATDDDLRCAVRYFQTAANIFELLKNDIMHFVPDELPRDMQPQLLNALSQLMITQANEVMYVKALKDGASPAVLRSLAMQISDMYGLTYKLLNYDQARGIVDKSWYVIVQAKEIAFQAIGTRHHFDHLEAGSLDTIEERLARAKEIVELFEKAEHIFPGAYKDEVRAAKAGWEKIEKDNNLIYHARIPNKSELPPIPRKSLLNIGTVKFPLSKDFTDLFVSLVSVHANKAINIFQGQLKERTYALLNDLRQSLTNTKSGLAAINMPALIEDELKQERIPASIITKAEDIRSKGGLHALQEHEKSLIQSSNEANSMISKIRATLEAEERSDAALRTNYGARWSPVASGNLTAKFKQEIGKYAGIISTADASNEKVKSKIRLCERDVAIMSGPRESLLERVPPITSSATHQSQAVDKLRELMGVMNRELQTAEGLEKRLNEIKYDPTSEFLDILKREGSLEDPRINEFTSSKLDALLSPIAQEVTSNKDLRTNVLEEMRVWHQQYHSGSQTDEGRTKALQQLAAAYDAFLECDANLKEGTKFYNDLKVLLTRLQQQIDDFCFARQTEKEDIVNVLEPGKNAAEIVKSIAEKNKPAVPPPRPPPPAPSAAINRTPDIGQLNISGQSAPQQTNQAPAIPPRTNQAPPPSVPQHQAPYQPNVPMPPQQNMQHQQPFYQQQQPNYNCYQQPQQQQQFPGYPAGAPQPYYQQMPQLPFYGAFQSQAGANPQQQPYMNPYMTPYPTQYPPQHPQAPQQYSQASAPPPSNPNNPFAQ